MWTDPASQHLIGRPTGCCLHPTVVRCPHDRPLDFLQVPPPPLTELPSPRISPNRPLRSAGHSEGFPHHLQTWMVSIMALLLAVTTTVMLVGCGHPFGDGGAIVTAYGAPASQAAAASSPTVGAASSSTVRFSGKDWNTRTSTGVDEPGPNRSDGSLATNVQGGWSCAEVFLPSSLGYDTYTVKVSSPTNDLHENVVFGLFTYADVAQNDLSNPHREFDVEVAKWGVASDNTNTQYAVQPYQLPGQRLRFAVPGPEATIHAMTWSPNELSWTSTSASSGALLQSWSFKGTPTVGAVPPPGTEVFHINLWLYEASLPQDHANVEIVVDAFSFQPLQAPSRKLLSLQRHRGHHRHRSARS